MASNKKEFKYHLFYRKWLFSILVVIIGLVPMFPFSLIITNKVILLLITTATMVIAFSIFYVISTKCNLFTKTGYYWTNGKIITLQLRKKEIELDNLIKIVKAYNTFFGVRCATLTLFSSNKKITISSTPVKKGEEIESSSLSELFELILKNNPKLKKSRNVEAKEDIYS